MARLRLFSVTSLVLLVPGTVAAQNYYLFAYSTCTIAGPPADSTYVIWTTYEPVGPNLHPNWVGYDVYRRIPTACGGWESFVKVNELTIPRTAGITHTAYYGEPTPAPATLFEYWVQPVDAYGQLYEPGYGFCSPCNAFQICAPYSAPITIGIIQDWGWTVYISPCSGSCYPGAYVSEPQIADQLRPFAGTSAAFRFFGTIGCGSVEGCSIAVEHYEATTCVTPTATRSWGQLKTLYR